VLPAFERIKVESPSGDVRLLAFTNLERTQFTLVGSGWWWPARLMK